MRTAHDRHNNELRPALLNVWSWFILLAVNLACQTPVRKQVIDESLDTDGMPIQD